MPEKNSSLLWSSVPFHVVSYIMFGLSNYERRKAKQLQQAHPLTSVADALNLANFLPVLIAVRGKTGSKTALQPKITSTPAVVIEDTAEWNILKQNEKGIWLPDSEVCRQSRSEAKWYISDESRARLTVESSADATHIGRTLITATQFLEGDGRYYKKVLNKLAGYQPLGIWQTEKCLPVGANVTVVGELAMGGEADEAMVVRKPSTMFAGRPFYITNQTFDELKKSIKRNEELYGVIGGLFGAGALILSGIHIWKQIRSALNYRKIRKRIEEEEKKRKLTAQDGTQDGTQEGSSSQSSRNQQSGELRECIVCWDNPADAVFIPCGHICACLRCCKQLRKCPFCRAPCDVYKLYVV